MNRQRNRVRVMGRRHEFRKVLISSPYHAMDSSLTGSGFCWR